MKRLMIAGLVVVASVAMVVGCRTAPPTVDTAFETAQGVAVFAIVASMVAASKTAAPPEGWRD